MKQQEKERKEKLQELYGYALVDGSREKIANWQVEPPGLFLGRGQHPCAGKMKRRLMPEDVTLNLSTDAPVPPPSLEGHRWKAVVHLPHASWIACWRDHITGSERYTFMAVSSRMAQDAAVAKFDKARQLVAKIADVRQRYETAMSCGPLQARQLATAMWMVDRLALRIGNEKDNANAVGCCSLRVEHILLTPPSRLTLDFVGNDSLRYYNSLALPEAVWANLCELAKHKAGPEMLFEGISAAQLRGYIHELAGELSPKELRIFNCSMALQRELDQGSIKDSDALEAKIAWYNACCQAAAVKCNVVAAQPPSLGSSAPVEQCRILRSGRVVEYNVGDRKALPRETYPLGQIALSTTKVNYLDPRITSAWCKRFNVPIEKIYSKLLREKFPWASGVGPEWRYDISP